MIFLKKNIRKYDIFFRCSEKMVFSKRTAPGHDLSCTIWKSGILFRKHGIFSLYGKRERDEFPQEIQGNMTFDMFIASLQKKYQGRSYPAKIHLKVVDIPDGDRRKSSSNSPYIHGDLYRRFHILLFSKKKKETGNLIYWD